jgi:hypothetical protein
LFVNLNWIIFDFNKTLIPLSTIQVLKWLHLPLGLLAVAAAFATVSWAGYFAIHELKENNVKKIQKKTDSNC